jgi:hypothetical protein
MSSTSFLGGIGAFALLLSALFACCSDESAGQAGAAGVGAQGAAAGAGGTGGAAGGGGWGAASGAGGGACDPPYGTFEVGNWPSGCWRPYADNSPFNEPIPPNPTLHPDSAGIVDYLSTHNPGPNALQVIDTANFPDVDYFHPTYYPQSADPLFTFHCTQPWGTCAIEGMQVRIPDAALPAGGTDGHLTVVDQASGWEYDLWAVSSKPAGGGVIEAGWGGRTRIDGDGLGGMAVAAGYGNLAGIIRAQEMEAGVIRHALFMVVRCVATAWVWPANQAAYLCQDLGLPDEHAVPNGARFQLDLSDDEIASLDAPAWKKTILTAMAHYGMYVGDTGSDPWGIEAESGRTYTSFGSPDPFLQFAIANGIPLSTNQYRFDLSDGVDWSRLRVIDPCVAQGNCP